jgi:hypothetical protein
VGGTAHTLCPPGVYGAPGVAGKNLATATCSGSCDAVSGCSACAPPALRPPLDLTPAPFALHAP